MQSETFWGDRCAHGATCIAIRTHTAHMPCECFFVQFWSAGPFCAWCEIRTPLKRAIFPMKKYFSRTKIDKALICHLMGLCDYCPPGCAPTQKKTFRFSALALCTCAGKHSSDLNQTFSARENDHMFTVNSPRACRTARALCSTSKG